MPVLKKIGIATLLIAHILSCFMVLSAILTMNAEPWLKILTLLGGGLVLFVTYEIGRNNGRKEGWLKGDDLNGT